MSEPFEKIRLTLQAEELEDLSQSAVQELYKLGTTRTLFPKMSDVWSFDTLRRESNIEAKKKGLQKTKHLRAAMLSSFVIMNITYRASIDDIQLTFYPSLDDSPYESFHSPTEINQCTEDMKDLKSLELSSKTENELRTLIGRQRLQITRTLADAFYTRETLFEQHMEAFEKIYQQSPKHLRTSLFEWFLLRTEDNCAKGIEYLRTVSEAEAKKAFSAIHESHFFSHPYPRKSLQLNPTSYEFSRTNKMLENCVGHSAVCSKTRIQLAREDLDGVSLYRTEPVKATKALYTRYVQFGFSADEIQAAIAPALAIVWKSYQPESKLVSAELRRLSKFWKSCSKLPLTAATQAFCSPSAQLLAELKIFQPETFQEASQASSQARSRL